MPVLPPMKAADLSVEVDLTREDLGLGQFLNNPDPDRYAIEKKVDGCRIKILLQADGNKILSQDRDVSDHFPHLRDATIDGADGILLDGELLANGPDGRILSAATSLLTSSAVNAFTKQKAYGAAWMVVFDILEYPASGENVMAKSYDERREILEVLVPPLGKAAEFLADYWFDDYPEVPIQLIESEPATVAAMEKHRKGEGFMIKERKGKYRPGGRDGGGWYKFKWLSTADAVIVGYKPGKNSLSNMVGSVELALLERVPSPTATTWTKDGIHYRSVPVASVGVFTNAFREALTAPDGSLKREYYGKVMEFESQGIGTGGKARHPRFVKMRPDKDPTECGLEQLDSIPKV